MTTIRFTASLAGVLCLGILVTGCGGPKKTGTVYDEVPDQYKPAMLGAAEILPKFCLRAPRRDGGSAVDAFFNIHKPYSEVCLELGALQISGLTGGPMRSQHPESHETRAFYGPGGHPLVTIVVNPGKNDSSTGVLDKAATEWCGALFSYEK